MTADFEAIIIGAGPAGAATAIGLAQQGRSVAIIERAEFPRRKVCGEFTSAINLDLLDRLGVGVSFRAQAGPEIGRVALFAAGPAIYAPMPKASMAAFGRALGRDILDGILLDAARALGVTVLQPWRAFEITRGADFSSVRIESATTREALRAPVIVAAHGSWEQGKLSTNLPKRHLSTDFLGFKAHFCKARLPRDLMPLIAFPGGYGGMVWADHDRLSLSFCIRRDALAAARASNPGQSAAAAAFAHIMQSCPAVAEVLDGAELQDGWLAAGPIRPGIRAQYSEDIFRVGNIAGESHPIIAEGIAMALQSGWLLSQHLGRFRGWDAPSRKSAGNAYSRAWRRQFSTRIVLASVLAPLAAGPRTAGVMHMAVTLCPAILGLGARLSGKTRALPSPVA